MFPTGTKTDDPSRKNDRTQDLGPSKTEGSTTPVLFEVPGPPSVTVRELRSSTWVVPVPVSLRVGESGVL